MSSDIVGNFTVSPAFTNKDTLPGLTTPTEKINKAITNAFTNGTADNQLDTVFTIEVAALATTTTDSYDLSGTLEDGLGNVSVFAKVKIIMIKSLDANVGLLNLDGTIANAFMAYQSIASKTIIQPDGSIVLIAPNTGYAVTAGTADILAIENPDATNTAGYELTIIGTSA